MHNQPSLSLKEGVEATLLKYYSEEILRETNRKLWRGDYTYEIDVAESEDESDSIEVRVDLLWRDLPDGYVDMIVMYFSPEDFENFDLDWNSGNQE